MPRKSTVVIPQITIEFRVYKDPSYDERFPWVLEVNGSIWNSYSMKPTDKLVQATIYNNFVTVETKRYFDFATSN